MVENGIRFDSVMIEKNLPHKELLRILFYDPSTGEFIWRVSLSNRALVGSKAGCKANMHWAIAINGKRYPAHHIAIYYYSGMYPHIQVDHRDGDGTNNRIDNLRLAGSRINMQNRRHASKNNKTGFLGVYFDALTGRYRTSIRANGKTHRLGRFDTP